MQTKLPSGKKGCGGLDVLSVEPVSKFREHELCAETILRQSRRGGEAMMRELLFPILEEVVYK